jgi:hypothetical protein
MTVLELKNIIDARIEGNPRCAEHSVCIPNNKGGMGGTAVTKVVSATGGIDWDASKFFIHPEKKMQEMGIEPVKDWKARAIEWAESQMPEGWNRKDGIQIASFYSWMLMYIGDQFKMFTK